MKRFLAPLVAAALLAAAPAPAANASNTGGPMGACIGCCFGIRTVADWNGGKRINVRDILDLIYIGRIWSAFEGWTGTTRDDLHRAEPSYF
jgi:hypothetical protein